MPATEPRIIKCPPCAGTGVSRETHPGMVATEPRTGREFYVYAPRTEGETCPDCAGKGTR